MYVPFPETDPEFRTFFRNLLHKVRRNSTQEVTDPLGDGRTLVTSLSKWHSPGPSP